MQQITPELTCFSELYVLSVGANLSDSQELDFNLARRTGIVICEIQGDLAMAPSNADHSSYLCQEIDLDPDNDDIWDSAGGLGADKSVIDTSRIFRQTMLYAVSNTDGWGICSQSHKTTSWRSEPLYRRPISITNIRHHMRQEGGAFIDKSFGKIQIQYVVVELTLAELGYLNASRR